MAIFTGLARLGRDAETRYTQGGDPVASLSLAFSYGRKGEDGKQPTQWIDASLWGKRAESLAPHLTKGKLISVVLQDLHIETFDGRNGQGHKLAARVVDLEFAGGGEAQPRQQATQAPRRDTPAATPDDFSDDIPF